MTAKADFTAQEWDEILEAPPSAAMMVITAQRGGTLRETLSMAKAYVETRQQHGNSELLDEIVAAKPEIDHTRYHSPEELKDHALGHLRAAVSAVEAKATAEESLEYKRFIVSLTERVARAHSEGGSDPVGDAERSALAEIDQALGPPPE